jgi:hypothetical protein
MRSATGIISKLRALASGLLAAVVFGAFLVLAGDVMEPMPSNAILLLDDGAGRYFSPPLMMEDNRSLLVEVEYGSLQKMVVPATDEVRVLADGLLPFDYVYVNMTARVFYIYPKEGAILLRLGTKQEARTLGYSPDKEHVNRGGFMDIYSVVTSVLRRFDLRKGRWTADGDWNR